MHQCIFSWRFLNLGRFYNPLHKAAEVMMDDNWSWAALQVPNCETLCTNAPRLGRKAFDLRKVWSCLRSVWCLSYFNYYSCLGNLHWWQVQMWCKLIETRRVLSPRRSVHRKAHSAPIQQTPKSTVKVDEFWLETCSLTCGELVPNSEAAAS